MSATRREVSRPSRWHRGSRQVSKKKAASSGEEPQIFSRLIVDGVQQELATDSTMKAALGRAQVHEANDRPGTGEPSLRIIVPHSTPEIIADLASAWQLHPLLVEDLLHASQRPKVERYDDVLFLVLKSAHYVDENEEVEFNEFHLLMKDEALLVICQDNRLIDGTPITTSNEGSDDPLGELSHRMFSDDDLLRLGPEALVYRLLDTVVDGYFPVLDGLQIDKEQIERQVFSGDVAAAERIYLLSQEVIDVLHATTYLSRLTQALGSGASKYAIPEELQAYLSDVSDHLTRVLAETTAMRDALAQILNVNATLVAQRQNEDMKKISGWAAILFAPTLIGAIYGMNFDSMPELHWALGYPLAVGSMIVLAAVLYTVFRLKKWM